MTLSLHINPEVEESLRAKAAAAGQDVASYAAGILERFGLRPRSLQEISGPLADEFTRSGMTDDELAQLLESEKHAMRAERRVKGS